MEREIKLLNNEINDIMSKAKQVINKRTATEATINVKVEIKDDTMKITAMNTSFFAIYDLNTTADKGMNDMSFLINTDMFTSAISKITTEYITLVIDDEFVNKLTIKGGKRKFNIGVMRDGLYPRIDTTVMDTNARFIAVERIKFINAVDNVIKMVSLTPVRPVLNGVNFKGIKDDTRITLIATDSYRLGRKNVSISEPLTEDVDIIVPKEALSYIVSMMKNSKDEEVKLHLTGDYFVVYADGQYIQARLIDGKYPDVSRLIPDQSAISNKLLINRK